MERIRGALYRGVLALLAGCCMLAAAPAHAGTLTSDLQYLLGLSWLFPRPVRVIVQFTTPSVNSAVFASQYGATLLGVLPSIKGASLTTSSSNLGAMSRDSRVMRISTDLPLAARYDYDVETTGSQQVWSTAGLTGTGVRIAVLDTGVDPNSGDWNSATDGRNRLIAFQDFVNGYSSAYDDNGHGTHVAGIAAGSGIMSQGAYTGSAPDADLVAVKVLGYDGSGLTSTAIQGLDWCVQHQSDLHIGVINLSLGHTPNESAQTDPLCAAVRRAVQAGIVVVCAAGNDGKDPYGNTVYHGIESPADEPMALTVGALNTFGTADRSDDGVCTFSSRGPTTYDNVAKPDVVAPGNNIISVRASGSYLDSNHPENRVQDPGSWSSDYFELSGTSMASPEVAGIVAQMLQASPALSPNTAKAVLMYTAQPVTCTHSSGASLSPGLTLITAGAGSVNAVGAVQLASAFNGSAAVGTSWVSPDALTGQSQINGVTIPWSQLVTWQAQVLSGSDLLALRQSSWSPGQAWGGSAGWAGTVQANDDMSPSDTSTVSTDPAPPAQITWSDTTFHGD